MATKEPSKLIEEMKGLSVLQREKEATLEYAVRNGLEELATKLRGELEAVRVAKQNVVREMQESAKEKNSSGAVAPDPATDALAEYVGLPQSKRRQILRELCSLSTERAHLQAKYSAITDAEQLQAAWNRLTDIEVAEAQLYMNIGEPVPPKVRIPFVVYAQDGTPLGLDTLREDIVCWLEGGPLAGEDRQLLDEMGIRDV